MTTIPNRTAEIFKVLSKGLFISSNSPNPETVRLYETIDEGENFEILREYFLHIGFVQERGDEFYYFSRQENRQDLESKIDRAYKWIDYMGFLKTLRNDFAPGVRFSTAEIVSGLTNNADLENKLNAVTKDSKSWEESVKKIIDDLAKDSFIELCDEKTGEYKVLSAFKYIENLIAIININLDEEEGK